MMFHNTTRARRRRGRVFRTLSKRARRREATRLPQPEGQGAAGCCAASAFCKAPFFCKTPFCKAVRLQKTITGFVIVNKSDRHPGGGQRRIRVQGDFTLHGRGRVGDPTQEILHECVKNSLLAKMKTVSCSGAFLNEEIANSGAPPSQARKLLK